MAHREDQRLQLNKDEQLHSVSLDLIKANPYQPRKTFDEYRLNDLAQSIKQHGILQPIVVRKTVQGYYIVVGERRFRASKKAGLTEIPAIIKELSDEDMMELAIIENLQREDLNAIEEAESYKKLMEDLNITQQEVAERLSKSRPYIANMLRLLKLPSDVAKMVRGGELSGAHGRTLLGLKSPQKMKSIAKKAVKESWSVRYLENYINDYLEKTSPTKTSVDEQTFNKPKFIQKQERQLKEQYGSKVDISTHKNIGKIAFEFKSEEEFKSLIKKLNQNYDM
ncbi:ParB/RepB/Spo0J family partition protein [Staphylococcus warneri]|uniref:ParB/RepB/Spo0J family partition protein n=1 Tax=Staphylococcus warneri TaxID=1292 RepID=UPI002557930C|nr:ParB/RepB/Spo0J family partition protein [Staphylococcus warneri]MDK7946579.1 ParB/RepB/Spo0J family partition protein [Staphylococcus warneri]MDK8347986.1 ParB/RepB/Spo0J family partition protein [Staphylococcus warneri]MDK8370932.1 ParB/RepB/Spo0J family partition protein [Staphylococcus warneri]